MEYDAIVVGGGPAGSVTARFAAELGAKVVILERRSEIGIPVLCGEGISQRIDNWGMLEGTRLIASKMDGAKIFSPDGTMVTLSKEMAGNETGYVVYRDIFDQELAHRAAKAGADIILIPETPFDFEKDVVDVLRKRAKAGYTYHMIATSEGAYPKNESL